MDHHNCPDQELRRAPLPLGQCSKSVHPTAEETQKKKAFLVSALARNLCQLPQKEFEIDALQTLERKKGAQQKELKYSLNP